MASDPQYGNTELFYASATAPTTSADPDDAAYNEVGAITTWSNTTSRQTERVRYKQGTTPVSGAPESTINVGCFTDLSGDAGQTVLVNAARATTPTTVYWIKTTGVSGDRYLYGTGTVSNMQDQSDTDSAASLTFTLDVVSETGGSIA